MDLDIRPLDLESGRDAQAAFEIERDYQHARFGWTDASVEHTTAQLTSPIARRDLHRLAMNDGTPVGALIVEGFPATREIYANAFAIGDDATAIQRALLDVAIDATREMFEADGDASSREVADPYQLDPALWQVTAAAYTEDVDYRSLLESLGFRGIRRWWRMIWRLDDMPAEEPVAPTGLTRRVVSGDADRRLLHRLYSESFVEHFGFNEEPFEEWIARLDTVDGTDPTRWWIAELDKVPVGLCILDHSRAAFGEDYVRTLGVLRSARGRGIATWLLNCAAADARRLGRTGVALTVDGENTTGATAVYERVGFTPRLMLDVYCLPFLTADDPRA